MLERRSRVELSPRTPIFSRDRRKRQKDRLVQELLLKTLRYESESFFQFARPFGRLSVCFGKTAYEKALTIGRLQILLGKLENFPHHGQCMRLSYHAKYSVVSVLAWKRYVSHIAVLTELSEQPEIFPSH